MNKTAAGWRGLLWLLVALSLSLYLMFSLRLVSDIGQFMPISARQPMLRVLEGELEHGPAATLLFLNIHGANRSEVLQLSKSLQAAISAQPGEIEFIRNGELQTDSAALQAFQAYRYLLTAPDWSVQGLHQALLARVSDLRAGAGPLVGQYLLADPYLSVATYLKQATGQHGPPLVDGVWYVKGTGALLLVKVRGKSLDLDRMQSAISSLTDRFDKLNPAVGIKLQIAGPGAMAVASRAAIQQTIQWISWVVALLMLVVFWLAYRSLWLMLLASVPLFTAILVGMALTQAIFSHVHGIVLAFGMTLLGMCLDYPLHLFSHCRAQETPQTSMQRIWPTLRLGGISSAIAFLVLLGSGFDGLSQLAVFAASGVLAALWVTRRLLPYWIRPDWIHPRYVEVRQEFTPRWQFVTVCLVFCLPLAACLRGTGLWETSVDAISPIPSAARKLDGRLRKAMGAANVSHLFVVESKDLEGVLEKTEKLAADLQPLVQDRIVTRIVPVTRILPSQATQHARQQRIPPADELRNRLKQAVVNTPFRAEAFAPFLAAAEQARHQATLGLQDLRNTPFNALLQQALIHSGPDWLSVIHVAGVKSDQALNAWLQAHPELAKQHMQTRKAVAELMSAYRQAAAERVLLALALLIVLVWIAVRGRGRMLRIVLPVVLSVVASLSVPLLLGHGLTVFHLLAALLVMGMGLDYSLFFNRDQHLPGEHKQSMHAIGISMLTTVMTFSVLALSAIPVMAAMGTVIAVGILLCFALAWVLAQANPLESGVNK